jgi:hypothetical protein
MPKDQVTIIGGGLSGLVAAISCAERGRRVQLHEAASRLGGRARSNAGTFTANFGPHALYKGRQNWAWLAERDLLPALIKPSARGVRYHHRERLRRTLPLALAWPLLRRRLSAPVEADFRGWSESRFGEASAQALCALAGAFTFDPDPGRLSAAFVWERLLWIYAPPSLRHIDGGWGNLVGALEARARQLGVEIATSSPVDSLPPEPLILATELAVAAELLDDRDLRATGPEVVLLDLGLGARRSDPSAVVDLERGALIERYAPGPSAPPASTLYQAHLGLVPGTGAEAGVEQIEALFDQALGGWRERVRWRRRQLISARTGALDLPGATWRDRPAIKRAEGVYLIGDAVAAPGLLSEVCFTSATSAAAALCAERSPALAA